jgi:hypothetical protein
MLMSPPPARHVVITAAQPITSSLSWRECGQILSAVHSIVHLLHGLDVIVSRDVRRWSWSHILGCSAQSSHHIVVAMERAWGRSGLERIVRACCPSQWDAHVRQQHVLTLLCVGFPSSHRRRGKGEGGWVLSTSPSLCACVASVSWSAGKHARIADTYLTGTRCTEHGHLGARSSVRR